MPSSTPSVTPTILPTSVPSLPPSGYPTPLPSSSAAPSQAPSRMCDQDFFRDTWSETGSNLLLDVDNDGDYSIGDVVVFDKNTIDRSFTTPGVVAGWCKVISIDGLNYCVVTFDMPEGLLLTQGTFESMAITTGTDCYEEQGGAVFSNELEDTIEYRMGEVAFIPNLSCDDITGQAWTGTGFTDYVDTDGDGTLSPGDSYYLDEAILTAENGVSTGRLVGECTILQNNDFDSRYCFLTGFFDGGSLTFQGPFHAMLVTAGTGCFGDSAGLLSGTPDLDTEIPNAMKYQFLTLVQPNEDVCRKNRFRGEGAKWIETGDDVFVDRDGDTEDSPGDAYLFNHIVTTPGNGRNGAASGYCLYLETLQLDTYCSISFDFEEGSITVQGFFDKLVIGTGEMTRVATTYQYHRTHSQYSSFCFFFSF